MRIGQAVVAGMVGSVVMSLIMAVARAMGMQANLEMMLGTMLGMAPGTGTWWIGFVMHLMAGAVFAIIYGEIFEHVTHKSGWGLGLGFGFVHAVVSGLALAGIPAIHPLIPEAMPAPGAFMSNLGVMGVVAFVMLHLIYGAIVGAMYHPIHHKAPTSQHYT